MLLGCIGDDFTGSSDLANTLAKEGMRVVQYTGTPAEPASNEVDAGVIALKSRSIDPNQAVAQSLEALAWLKAQGCTQFLFKYCSTFDSTPEGNIGPVADALAEALDATTVIACPAFPGTGRSVYQGHLFVNNALLSESGMENHPLTPMTDPDLRRWLALQSDNPIAHVDAQTVLSGPGAIRNALTEVAEKGRHLVIVDAIRDQDLRVIGHAASQQVLITGGSGIALGLPDNFKRAGVLSVAHNTWRGEAGPCVILSGSCSIATRQQLKVHSKDNATLEIEAGAVLNGDMTPQRAAQWALSQTGLPVIFSSADPNAVKAVQAEYGRHRSAEALEAFFAETARQLTAGGVTRLITAGGETSGAVVEGLTLGQLKIGPEIDPGVPALRAGPDLVVALKSGNFGAPDFFAKAAAQLAGDAIDKTF
ncbi:MAG: 3-oxo-tetronate kinase [Pseudomonadota bacterium]